MAVYQVHYRGNWFPMGTHIRIKRPSGIHHHAIIVGGSAFSAGPAMVMDNAKTSGVLYRSLEEVAAGDPVEVVAFPQSPEHANAIVEHAFSQRGASYDLFNRNCEHYATWCMAGVPRSYQLNTFAAVALGVVAVGFFLTAGK